MVRNYKKKKQPKYDQDSLLLAMETVIKEGKSIRSVAKDFNIPFQTLRKHVLNPNLKCGSGVQTVLSEVEEDHLAHALVYLSECGAPQGMCMLKQMVASFMKSLGRSNPFKDDVLGRDWVEGFEARNKAVLTRRKPEILTVARSKALTSQVVNEFFKMWEALILKHNFQEAPGRVFNCDETGLTTNPVYEHVYVGKGSKDAYLKTPNFGKTMFSVLFCASATVHVTEANNNLVNLSRLEEGVTYVLDMYEGSCFPGLVSKLNKKSVEVSCMAKNGLFGWRWPIQPDLHAYPPEDLVAVIEPPRALNKRNNYSRP